ncbi:hypothetical protein [Shewanella frigidimarina]|uniref:hypothetical protein n=1 Tax=Shewanella frigidimarina TaxID=56812 RepID=UPI003D7AF39A
MSKVDKERVFALKFIESHPQEGTNAEELSGNLVDDLIKSQLVSGIRSNELNRSSEPIYFNLEITTKGREYIESRQLLPSITKKFHNPWVVALVTGIVCVILGSWLSN